jgi:ubiquinone/menaquinone biosynthesis C-methylase UbiE
MADFTVEQARAFYDRFGRKQDWQSFYEDPATRLLIEHGAFEQAHRVVEFGCGTGRFAERLLRDHLAADSSYLGIDVSRTMVGLARERLRPWANRVEIRLSDGSSALAEPDASADRFLSNYVFDLLGTGQIDEVLNQAHRALRPAGLLCVVSLTHGRGIFAGLVCAAWKRIHAFSPRMVGGCRPLELTKFVGARWRIDYLNAVSSFGVTSEVLIAAPQSPS